MTAPKLRAYRPAFPVPAPEVVTPCAGTSTLVLYAPEGAGYLYRQCPGCDDCDRLSVAARLAFAAPRRPADPFHGIPTDTDDEDF